MYATDRSTGAPAAQTYRESAPAELLREHVVCFWHRPADAPASAFPVLPDGCTDVIWAGELPPFVAGPMTLSVMPTTSAGTEIVGVRFRPGIAPVLLGVSASELRDRHIPLRDIWPHPLHQPWADAAAPTGLPARLSAITAAIADRLIHASQPDPFVTEAARSIASQPSGSLSGLSARSGLSERQMRRRFDDAIGYGPKTLQRILRLQRLLWLASQPGSAHLDLSKLAFAAGFADQPHMTREVTALAGSTPRLLLQADPRSAVSDFFKTPSS